jgi:hypothetical protein
MENNDTTKNKITKTRKTYDEKIKALNAQIKLLEEKKKLAETGKSNNKLTITSVGMPELMAALKFVTRENKAVVADVIKTIAIISKVGVRGRQLNENVIVNLELKDDENRMDQEKEALDALKIIKKTTKSSVIIY